MAFPCGLLCFILSPLFIIILFFFLIVFVAWAWQDVGARLDDFAESVAVRWSLLFLLALFLLFLWWIRLAVRRWNMEDRAS